MAETFRDIDPDRVRARLEEIESRVPAGTEVLVACKYVPSEEMGALAEAGVELVGENRLADLERKRERWGDTFTWDFIGNVQSRKLRAILPLTRLIHSVHSASVLRELGKHGGAETEVLIQVNVAAEEGKGGVAVEALGETIAACPVRVVGLSTMPPFTADPERSRPHFARLAALAAEHGLERLSMGTSQDWQVAIEEGATTIRIGSVLFD